MTSVGWVGIGKLGLPCSVACAEKGHDVRIYDLNPNLIQEINRGFTTLQEPDLEEKLRKVLLKGNYRSTDLKTLVDKSEIIFVAVPTPSLPNKSFDTKYIKDAVRSIVSCVEKNSPDYKLISVISTVLPTTIRKEVYPIIAESGKEIGLCYNAYFIAMSTTIADWLDPEFVLVGEAEGGTTMAGELLQRFYRTIIPNTTPIFRMTYEEAELTKMSYNCYIGAKIVIANALMEFCDRIEHADCDVVSNALSHANRRIVGKNYMKGGMGDGGPCHGRDNDALSWFANKIDLSADPFGYVMMARQQQTKYLANVAISLMRERNLPLVILGKRFKWNSNLVDYSPSLLLSDILTAKEIKHTIYDPPLDGERHFDKPAVFVATVFDEACFKDFPFPRGSVVIDVWRFLKDKEGITYYRVGGMKEN